MNLKANLFWALPLTALVGMSAVSAAQAQTAFSAGDLVVYRVGDGTAALGSGATAVFLDEYSKTGTLIQSVAAPTVASGTNNILTASGSAASEGELNLSADGKYLALTGYNAALGTASVAASSAARVVGIVGNGTFDTSTSLTGATFAANNIRGAVTTDGTNIYAVGANSGVINTTKGTSGTGTAISTTVTNLRDVVVSNGQLYVSSSSGSTRIAAVGTGTPTTAGQTTTNLAGLTSTSPASPYAFFFASLLTTNDTLYVADNTNNVIDKFSLVGGSYAATGTITGINNIQGLTGFVSNGAVSLFATNATGIFSATDTTGYNGTAAGAATSIVTIGSTQGFRGLAYLPQSVAFATTGTAAAPEPGVLPLLAEAGALAFGFVAVRRRRK